MEIGSKIKQLRLQRGLTQEELAKLSNISQAAVTHYEKGVRKPSTNTMIQLAKVLSVDPKELTDDERSVV
jgi:transcriptional regulator with XRE-family HTH domain